MAALTSSSPIAGGSVGGFDRCACIRGSCSQSYPSRCSPPKIGASLLDQSLNAGRHRRRSSRHAPVSWSRSTIAGGGRVVVEKSGAGKKGNGLVIEAAAPAEEAENFLQSIGTQFFKVSGKKGGVGDGPTGTQFFGLGGRKKKSQEEEVPEEPKGGTQLFRFGAKKVGKGSQSSGTNGSALVRRESTGLESLQFGRGRRVDPKTVFVAGATGQIGARISQQLLRAGFNVRGGVPDLYVAQQLAEFASQYGVISRDEAKKLNAVEFDFKNVSSIAKALGNAGKVVVTVGPTEDGPLGKVSRADAARVLEAAAFSSAVHFVLVSEPGTGLTGENGPLAGLASLFTRVFSRGTEISDSDLVDKIVETGLAYTVVKAGSTDGVDDYAPEGGNLVVEAEGASDPSAKVSKVQIASMVAGVFQYTGVSENKFFEVTSSPYAPIRPVDELLSAIQVDGRREILKEEQARLAAEEKERELRSRAEADAQRAVAEARQASQLASQLEAEAKRLAAEEARAAVLAAKAQAKAEAAAASIDGLQVKAKELGGNPLKSLSGRPSFKSDDKPKKPVFSFPKKPQPMAQPVPAAASPAPKSSGFFGGLFAPQENIYVEED